MKPTSAPAWYSSFFTGAALELWRRAIPPETTEQEVEFLAESLEAPEGGKLLDLPCGNGRLTLPMAEAGFKMTGIDISADFIDEGKKAAKQGGQSIEYFAGDVLDFKASGQFAGAFCMGNSFGYFDHDGTERFFKVVSESLEPGARFVLDSAMVAESFLVNGGEREWVEVGDMLMLIENNYDVRESVVETNYTFIQSGKQQKRTSLHWIYTAGDISRMLARVGLVTEEMYGSADFDQYELGSDRLLLVARKGE